MPSNRTSFDALSVMPRFYLHLVIDGHRVHDTHGIDLPDIEAARSEALTVTQPIAAGLSDRVQSAIRVEIADARGNVLARVIHRDNR